MILLDSEVMIDLLRQFLLYPKIKN